MPPRSVVASVRFCGDCGTQLLPTNTGTRCAECALVRRNEQLTTPAMARSRDELLRAAMVAQRIAELTAENATGGREFA